MAGGSAPLAGWDFGDNFGCLFAEGIEGYMRRVSYDLVHVSVLDDVSNGFAYCGFARHGDVGGHDLKFVWCLLCFSTLIVALVGLRLSSINHC